MWYWEAHTILSIIKMSVMITPSWRGNDPQRVSFDACTHESEAATGPDTHPGVTKGLQGAGIHQFCGGGVPGMWHNLLLLLFLLPLLLLFLLLNIFFSFSSSDLLLLPSFHFLFSNLTYSSISIFPSPSPSSSSCFPSWNCYHCLNYCYYS